MSEVLSHKSDINTLETLTPENLSIYPICGTASGYSKHFINKTPYCAPCREASRLYRKDWGEKNRDRHNAISKKWVKENPDKHRVRMRDISRRRRAKKLSVESEFYTQDIILEIYGATCHICLKDIDLLAPQHASMGEGWELGLQLDHIVPISKGGNDKIENIRPSHALCNMKKGNK